jgi:hypothetical protein
MQLLVILAAFVLTLFVFAAFSAVLAFPFMWGWNYAITHTFGAPEIQWGHAFVLLLFIATFLSRVGVKEE